MSSEQQQTRLPASLVPLNTEGEGVHLFCVHPSSGSPFHYYELAKSLQAGQRTYGVQAPSLPGSGRAAPSIRDLAAVYSNDVREVMQTVEGSDVALLGWSLGGIIAHAIACRLQPVGDVSVKALVLVDVSVPRIASLPPEKQLVLRFLQELFGNQSAILEQVAPVIETAPDDDAHDLFVRLERSGDWGFDDLDAGFLTERYTIFRALVAASYAYTPTETYYGPAMHLTARDSGLSPTEWPTFIPALRERSVPGDHHTLWLADGLAMIATAVDSSCGANSEQ